MSSIGVTVKTIRRPWRRCQYDMHAGNVDAILPVIWHPGRDAWGVFPKRPDGSLNRTARLWSASYQVFSYQGSLLEWDGSHFSGVSYGVSAPLGHVSYAILKQLDVSSEEAYDLKTGFQLLALKRLDGYVMESLVGQSIINANGWQGMITVLDRPFSAADWYLPLSHDFVEHQPQLSQRIWWALGKARESSRARLVKRYMPEVKP